MPPKEDDPHFIRPTQGLKLRHSGGLLHVNLENIGGRILYMEEMNGHKNRMKEIKPVVSLTAPWGHEDLPRVPVKVHRDQKDATELAPVQSKKGNRKKNSQKKRQEETELDSGLSAATKKTEGSYAAAAQPTSDSVRDFDVGLLRPEQQELYRKFVAMLCELGNDDSRAILEQAYRESEEKKLLSGYTGIFPTLDEEEPPSSEAQQTAPPQEEAAERRGATPD
eukprot:RCo008964